MGRPLWDGGLIERLMDAAWEQGAIPGIGCCVVNAGDEPVTFVRGRCGLSDPAPLTATTRFPVASVSKAMAAYCAAVSHSGRGDLLGSSMAELVAGLSFRDHRLAARATVGNAMSHDLGAPNPLWLYHGGGVDEAELVRRAARLPGAGIGFSYNDTLYALAGMATEAHAGAPLVALLNESIFQPLVMSSTGLGADLLVASPAASGSAITDDRGSVIDDPVRPNCGWSMDVIAASGAVVSTLADLTRWARELLRPHAISGEAVGLITDRRTAVPASPPFSAFDAVSYGLGVRHFRSRQRRCFGHGGLFRGVASLLVVWPEADQAIVMVGNARHAYEVLFELAAEIGGICCGDAPRDPVDVLQDAWSAYRSSTRVSVRRWTPPTMRNESMLAGDCTIVFRNELFGSLELDRRGDVDVLRGPGPYIAASLRPVDGRSWFPVWDEALPNYRPASLVVVDDVRCPSTLALLDEERGVGWSAFERVS